MRRSYFLLMGLLSLIWGGSFFFIKLLLADFHPWSIAFLRSAFGVATLLGVMAVMRRPFAVKRAAWLPLIAVGLFNTAVPWTLIAFSEVRLTSSMASVLNATTPLWTLLVGIAFFRGRATRYQWFGLALGFVGLLVLLDINPGSVIGVDLTGFLGMVLATLCYAVSSHISKRYLTGVSMYETALGTLIVGMAGSGFAALATEPFSPARVLALSNLLPLVGLGVFGTGLAYLIYFTLIQKGSPELANMVTYLIPATAILWGALLLGEHVGWNLLAGLLLILAGVYLAGRAPVPAPATARPNECSSA